MKNLKNILSATLVAGLLSACSGDYLDTVPTTSINNVQATKDVSALRTIVEGIHNMMYNYKFSSGQLAAVGQPGLNVRFDMLGDDMINTVPAFHMSQYRWQNHNTPYTTFNYEVWDYYYTLIQHCNEVIDGASHLSGADPKEVASVLGEAHAFRAYCYFYLVQCFGKRYEAGKANDTDGVPLRLKQAYVPVPRSTVAETYAQIDKDMKLALENLEKAPDLGRKNVISLAAANGIAARIALAKQDYAAAEMYADAAIKASGASFGASSQLLNGFNNWNTDEWIWGYHQNTDQNIGYFSFYSAFSYNYEGGNEGFKFAVRRDLYDLMGVKDVRRQWWICLDNGDKVPEMGSAAYFEVTKDGPNWETTGQQVKYASTSQDQTLGDLVIMRLAELYYIKAEAQARQGKNAEAEETLDAVMISRDPDYKFAETGRPLIDEIMRNKRIDLWMEGQRWFDMKRLGIIPDRLNSKNIQVILKENDTKKYETAVTRNSGENAQYLPKTMDDPQWQFAIPYDEIKATGDVVKQNPL